jgi:hypothetical protein
MADNYREFSELVEGITPEERAWIRQVLDFQGNVLTALKNTGIRPNSIDPDCWPMFQWELRDHDADLWIYSTESGAVEHVGEFVRAFLSRFRPTACWSMTWADSCSKPRIGEFSGGGLFVIAKSVKLFCADDALNRMHRRFEKARRRPAGFSS